MEELLEKTDKETVKENKMGTAPVGKLLLSMAVPSIASMLIQAAYNIVDSVFVSRISDGQDALTAVSLAFPIQMLMIGVSVGTGVGINSYISRKLGEKKHLEARQSATHGMVLAILSCLVFALIGLFVTKPFLGAYSAEGSNVYEWGVSYTQIVTIFSFGAFMQIVVSRIFQSCGNMTPAMIIQMIGAISNIILDPIFIFGYFGVPAMGVAGAAIATVIGQWIATISGLLMLHFMKNDVKPIIRGFKWNWGIVKRIYDVGFPSIIMQSVTSFVILAMNGILIGFSEAAVSVLGVYGKLQSFIFMPVFGLMQGSLPIVAYNFGARNKERMMRCFKLAIIWAMSIMAVGSIVFNLFTEQLLNIFNASEEMMSIGVVALRIISLSFVLAGAGITISNLFQAIGRGFYSLLTSLLRQVIVILPLAWILSRVVGLNGIWYAYPISECVSLIASILFLIRVMKNDINVLDKDLSAQSSIAA